MTKEQHEKRIAELKELQGKHLSARNQFMKLAEDSLHKASQCQGAIEEHNEMIAKLTTTTSPV